MFRFFPEPRRLHIVVCSAILVFLLAASCLSAQPPQNIILMIGDGMGVGHISAARVAAAGSDGRLAMDTMPFTGLIVTHPAQGLVTDSAAAATAMATGRRVSNGSVSMDGDGNRLRTIVQLARELGKATGIISTKSVTDATPAAFVSSVRSRSEHDEIAAQLITSGADVVLGGGRKHFLPSGDGSGARKDARDLLAEARALGYDVVDTAEGMVGSAAEKMIGLFAPDSMTTRAPEPSLAEMTARAIDLLARRENGFFLMAEGAQIDTYAHANNVEETIRQTLLFDEAVRVALDFAAKDGRTLVVVTADHDTGGMALLDGDGGSAYKAGWVGGGHTGNMVPLYAFGPGAERFTGTHDNTRIPTLFAELWGLSLK